MLHRKPARVVEFRFPSPIAGQATVLTILFMEPSILLADEKTAGERETNQGD